MGLFQTYFAVASVLHPLPRHYRKPGKELKVICVGLPRSGTGSLHNALEILGYDGVSHGFPWWAKRPDSSKILYKLARLKSTGDTISPEALRKQYFNSVFDQCEAITDVPGAWFSAELLRASSQAEVVLNRRKDVKSWKDSFRASILPLVNSWQYWLWSWFNAELFWHMALTYEEHTHGLFRGDFEANAEIAHNEHYERLEEALTHEGRPYLKWPVEDGWQPLCNFLKKPVPAGNFPNGNVAAQFEPKLLAIDNARFQSARRNAMLLLVVFIAGLAAICSYFML